MYLQVSTLAKKPRDIDAKIGGQRPANIEAESQESIEMARDSRS